MPSVSKRCEVPLLCHKRCHRTYTLENGRIVIVGSREDLMSTEHVREAYLRI